MLHKTSASQCATRKKRRLMALISATMLRSPMNLQCSARAANRKNHGRPGHRVGMAQLGVQSCRLGIARFENLGALLRHEEVTSQGCLATCSAVLDRRSLRAPFLGVCPEQRGLSYGISGVLGRSSGSICNSDCNLRACALLAKLIARQCSAAGRS